MSRWTRWLVLLPAILLIGLLGTRIATEGNIIKDLNRLGIEVDSRRQELPWMEGEKTVLYVRHYWK